MTDKQKKSGMDPRRLLRRGSKKNPEDNYEIEYDLSDKKTDTEKDDNDMVLVDTTPTEEELKALKLAKEEADKEEFYKEESDKEEVDKEETDKEEVVKPSKKKSTKKQAESDEQPQEKPRIRPRSNFKKNNHQPQEMRKRVFGSLFQKDPNSKPKTTPKPKPKAKPKIKKKRKAYTSVKTRPTRLIFNKTSGASARADFSVDKSRYYFIWFIALSLFVALIVRLFYVQVVNAKMYQEKGNEFITSVRTVPTYRGMITDRNNLPLAVSAPLSTVSFSPKEYAKAYYQLKQKMAKNLDNEKMQRSLTAKLKKMDLNRLAATVNIDVAKLRAVAHISDNVNVLDDKAIESILPTGAGSYYYPLLSKVPPEVAERVLELDFIGVYKKNVYQRYYPQSFPSSQLLGFMSQSAENPTSGYQGRSGLERKYEEQLSGIDGKVLMMRDARRVGLKEIKQLELEKAGQDIQLTIDSRLQFLLHKELEKVGRKQKAFWSSGMVVNVHTGEVLAMSTWPSFNINNLNEMTGENQRNRPISDSFEPGSVMKPFTVAAALESGRFSKNTVIDTAPGIMKVKGYTIRDHANLGRINFTQLLQYSSNVASTKIALQLPADSISNMQRNFGFGEKTALSLFSEKKGLIVTPKKRQTARRATASYGYGIQVTLAQIAQAYATLGAGGISHPLTLVKKINQEDLIQPPGKQVISQNNALSIVEMMESVTFKGGTAPEAAINGYRVAGKTGTSRRVNPNGGYYSDKYRTIFAGLAPVSDPRLVTVILVENPEKDKYAGKVAAPVFHNVMQEALRLYNIPLDKPLENR